MEFFTQGHFAPNKTDVLTVVAIYSVVAACHGLVPGRIRKGYAKDARGEVLLYRINGFYALLLVVAAAAVLVRQGVVSGTALYDRFLPNVMVSCCLGLVISWGFFLRGESPPGEHVSGNPHVRPASVFSRPLRALHAFFFGYELNPRVGLWDVKMYLYLIGAIQLELNLLSAVYAQYARTGGVSPALAVYALELSFFVVEYLWFEHVHTFTYDLIAENIGFKLVWGCLCFYPFFYACGVFAAVDPSNQPSTLVLALSLLCFYSGWSLSRGANLQKFHFKMHPSRRQFLGVVEQRAIGGRVLCSGWWGVSRHVNYLGEILMGVGLALPGGLSSWVPWLYPLFYVLILLPRERDDNERCRAKYGADWLEYERLVPYRIVPFLY